jgi:hypothetical protein
MMWNFSNDEWVLFVAAAAISLFGSVRYYGLLISVSWMRRSRLRRGVLALLPVAAIIPTCVILNRGADAQVVGHPDYIILFILGGAAWIFASVQFLGVLGFSVRDDVVERDNPAALAAVSGIVLGVGIVYALSNIGAGPTIWTTILPVIVATILLALMALFIEVIGGAVADAVTIDRDVPTALRLAGAVLGCAIILGRAASGDWISWNQTWVDLVVYGWPAVLVVIAAGIAQRLLRPTAVRPRPGILGLGVIPATCFVTVGILVAFIR